MFAFVFVYLYIVFVFLYLFIVFVFVPEVVRAHESLITNWTLKVLLSCVRPVKFIIYVYQKSIWEIEIFKFWFFSPQWANVSNFRIGMTLDFVKRQKSIHRILCQSPVPLSRGSLSEKIILSHCKVWILSLMAFPHRSGFVVTWYFPQTCHKTQTHKHTHKHTREKIPHTKTCVWRHSRAGTRLFKNRRLIEYFKEATRSARLGTRSVLGASGKFEI